ncbi:MAG: UPF0164 family protein [candidate division Zixibacteria bacterium]|nr:UPF0164 family protein [candidate division Zixibacteria bacterium]
MKKITIAMIAVALSISSAMLAASDGHGGQPGAFREVKLGGRPAAMGGAFTAVAYGGIGWLYNPAGISQLRKTDVALSYRVMDLDRRLGYAAITFPAREGASIGLSWIHAGTASLEARDVQGNLISGEDIASNQNLVGVTFGKTFIPQLAFGGRVFYVQHNIGNINAYSVGADFGFQGRFDLSKTAFGGIVPSAQVGLVVENIGATYKWTTSNYWQTLGQEQGSTFDEKFPVNYRLGGALVRPGFGILAADVEMNSASIVKTHFGAEYQLYQELVLRTGLDDLHPTFGFGLYKEIDKFALFIDLAYLMDKVGEGDDFLMSLDLMF